MYDILFHIFIYFFFGAIRSRQRYSFTRAEKDKRTSWKIIRQFTKKQKSKINKYLVVEFFLSGKMFKITLPSKSYQNSEYILKLEILLNTPFNLTAQVREYNCLNLLRSEQINLFRLRVDKFFKKGYYEKIPLPSCFSRRTVKHLKMKCNYTRNICLKNLQRSFNFPHYLQAKNFKQNILQSNIINYKIYRP